MLHFSKSGSCWDWQELEEAQHGVEEKMTRKLQMPPVMEERDAASKVTKAEMPLEDII